MIDFRVALLHECRAGPVVRAVPVAFLLMLAACTSVSPPPIAALQAAESIITQAEQASVAHYTSPELTRARVSLAAARSAVEKGQMLFALQLAERARLDAQLAIVRTEVARTELDTTHWARRSTRRGPKAPAVDHGSEAAVGLWRDRRLEVTVAKGLEAKR